MGGETHRYRDNRFREIQMYSKGQIGIHRETDRQRNTQGEERVYRMKKLGNSFRDPEGKNCRLVMTEENECLRSVQFLQEALLDSQVAGN